MWHYLYKGKFANRLPKKMNAHEQIRLFCHAKFAAYAIFYRGVACRSLFAALFLGGLAAIGSADWFSQALRLSSLFYPTFGLAIDAGFRFLVRREEFRFYQNATCSVVELYVVSFVISLLSAVPFFYLSRLL